MDMITGLPLWTVVVVGTATVLIIVIALAALITWRGRRSRKLKRTFGSEYERMVERSEDRKTAERELEQRLDRVHSFELRAVTADERSRFESRWTAVQSGFVDDPVESVTRADGLLVELMCAIGYADAGEGPERRAADLSVQDLRSAEQYRNARRAVEGGRNAQTSTEDLRQAMVQLRAVVDSIIYSGSTPAANGHKAAATR